MSESNSGYLTPDEITGASFETKRRGGLDPDAVKRHLSSVAATVHGLTAERDTLAEQIESLRAELEAAPTAATEPEALDEAELTERLGQDAARVLAEARSAAADRIAEADAEADDIRAAAEEIHAARSAEADEEAQRIRNAADLVLEERKAEAEREAQSILQAAEAGAEQVRTAGSSERESADADATRIIREAELTRRQILEDLARRRSSARRQIEQLRAGRERLLASHETVRRALDEISEELTISMSEARAAAETAGHSVSDTTIEELEAEIETARLTGLLDTGPVPVVERTPLVPESSTEPDDVPASEAATETPEASAADNEAADVVEPVDDTPADGETDGASEAVTEAPSETVTDTPDADDTTSGVAALAPVVQLDRARNDVDTATHPAKGREAGNGRPAGTAPSAPEKPISKALPTKVTKLESVKPAPDDASDDAADDDDSVGDLFASLRSATPAKPAEAKPVKKKAAAKKSTAKASTKKKKKAKVEKPLPEVDSSEMTRRLKRVLADEQSKAMSKVKSSDSLPSLDDLVGSNEAHFDTYWAEVLGQLDNPDSASDAVRAPILALVENLRRRVTESLEDAADDREAAVAALRSIYREVKTQHIAETADAVCRTAGVGVGS